MMYSIIIVNYKTHALVMDCLETIYKGKRDNIEIIIVDNFSQDDSEQKICTRFPAVKWIQMTYNAGFSRANNAGIRNSAGNIILLLNPDTLNIDDAIAKCFLRFAASAYAGCGVQLLNPDGTPQISGNYFITGGINQLLALPFIGKFIRRLGQTLKVKKTNIPEVSGTVGVDWINGAFLMVKKEAICKAGLLDEDFFLYFEEIEWCARLKKVGNLCIYGDLNIVHLQGVAANETFGSSGQGYYNLYDRKGLQIMVSALLRIRKQYGLGWYFIHLLSYLFTVPVFLTGILLGRLFLRKGNYTFKDFIGFTGNLFKVLSLSGRMIKNEPYFYKML